jgi:5'-nucleotidase
VYAVGGTPAQAVLHAVLEILPAKPDLVVSGINYGENVGVGITISGTVGAALEAAALGIPALAASLETDPSHHHSYSEEVDFSTAAVFTAFFGRLLLERRMPPDADVLKIDGRATPTRKQPGRSPGFPASRITSRPGRAESWEQPGRVGYLWEAIPARTR